MTISLKSSKVQILDFKVFKNLKKKTKKFLGFQNTQNLGFWSPFLQRWSTVLDRTMLRCWNHILLAFKVCFTVAVTFYFYFMFIFTDFCDAPIVTGAQYIPWWWWWWWWLYPWISQENLMGFLLELHWYAWVYHFMWWQQPEKSHGNLILNTCNVMSMWSLRWHSQTEPPYNIRVTVCHTAGRYCEDYDDWNSCRCR